MDKKAFSMMALSGVLYSSAHCASTWNCDVLPSEQKIEVDPQSGAKVIFVTTHPASDTNLYFHKRCFLCDNQLMLFYSNRFGRSEVLGYLMDTGELIRLNRPQDPAAGCPVASIKGDRLYVFKQGSIYSWKVDVTLRPQTAVRVTETKVMEIPKGAQQRSMLTENCDGTLIASAYCCEGGHFIGLLNPVTGQARPPKKVPFKPDHLQFHRQQPDSLAFCRVYDSDIAPLDPNAPAFARIWFLNVNSGVLAPAFYQVPGELVTHECWWVNDQMTFLGGHHHVGDCEEGHVKVFDRKTGVIRIIGAGAWLDDITGRQLARVNWWHASGSPDGKWIAADNWHGIVVLFNARTTEKKILTTGHRTYGGGHHLHVGWDCAGKYVEFTSNKRGNPDVCIAVIPKDW